ESCGPGRLSGFACAALGESKGESQHAPLIRDPRTVGVHAPNRASGPRFFSSGKDWGEEGKSSPRSPLHAETLATDLSIEDCRESATQRSDYWMNALPRARSLFDPLRPEGLSVFHNFQLGGLSFNLGEYKLIRPALQEEPRLRLGKHLGP